MTNRTLTLSPATRICPNLAVAPLAATRRRRSKHVSVVLSLAALLSACGDAGRSPTSASTPPAPATATEQATYVLSGVVFEITEAGRAPIEGVEVYCDGCGSPVGHTFAYTDADGFYSFSWTHNGPNPIFVRKAGYGIVDPTGMLRDPYGTVTATVNGDTRFDVQLARK